MGSLIFSVKFIVILVVSIVVIYSVIRSVRAKSTLPKVEIGDRVQAMRNILYFDSDSALNPLLSPMADTSVEGIVVQDLGNGTIKVKTDSGTVLDCLGYGAVLIEKGAPPAIHDNELKPVDVVAVQMLNGHWQARIRNEATPVGEGATSREAVQNLLLHKNIRRRPVEVEERFDPYV